MPWLAAAAAVAGGAMGAASSANQLNSANANQAAAVNQWIQLNVPDPAQQQLFMQQYQQTGQLSPQLEAAMKQGPSALQNITQNPQDQAAQMQALQELQNEGSSGGMNLQDQASLQQAEIQSNAAAKGRNDAITNQFAAQGLGGSGLQLQAQLQNSQNANENQAMTSLQNAADSRARALQAVSGAGQLGGQMANQDYQKQANLAASQNAINQFNTQNAQNVANTNVANQNAAQQYNLGLQQQIANANTGLANQQQAYNKGLIQQQYGNQVQKASGAANAQIGYGNTLANQAANTANMWAGIGSGIGKGISAYGTQNPNQTQNQTSPPPASNTNFGYGGQAATAGGDEDLFSNYS